MYRNVVLKNYFQITSYFTKTLCPLHGHCVRKEMIGIHDETFLFALYKLCDIPCHIQQCTVADPGFPVGGAWTLCGGHGPPSGHFLVKMYAKMKELGPIRSLHPARPPP